MLAMFLDMVGDIGRCWFLYVIVLQFWAVLGNVEQCWMMLAAPRYHEGSSSPLCSSNSLCNPFARSAGIFFNGKGGIFSHFSRSFRKISGKRLKNPENVKNLRTKIRKIWKNV